MSLDGLFNPDLLRAILSFSVHGQPEPIVGPPSLFRRSIAFYDLTRAARPGRSRRSSTPP